MQNTNPSLGALVFLGAGNMTEALVRGLLAAGLCRPDQVTVTDITPERRDYFTREFGVRALGDNRAAVRGARMVVLAVKPQVLPAVAGELAGALPPDALVISIAAGFRTARLEALLPERTRVVRVMPNTPALVGAGAAAWCRGRCATAADGAAAAALLRAVGLCLEVDEAKMDAVTALSGSGPAYVFRFLEALLEAARELGLEDDVARQLAYQTVAGAAELVRRTGEPPDELRRRVTSKGGTTEAALRTLDAADWAGALRAAVRAAARRSEELSGTA